MDRCVKEVKELSPNEDKKMIWAAVRKRDRSRELVDIREEKLRTLEGIIRRSFFKDDSLTWLAEEENDEKMEESNESVGDTEDMDGQEEESDEVTEATSKEESAEAHTQRRLQEVDISEKAGE